MRPFVRTTWIRRSSASCHRRRRRGRRARSRKTSAELFRNMAPSHAKPIRDFLLELSVGAASKQWVEIVRPAAGSLLSGARELGDSELADALAAFGDVLARASTAI